MPEQTNNNAVFRMFSQAVKVLRRLQARDTSRLQTPCMWPGKLRAYASDAPHIVRATKAG